MKAENRQLRVPPPPPIRREPKSRSKTRRKRSSRRPATWLVAAIMVVGLLTACLIVAAIAATAAPFEGGRINLLLMGIDRRKGTDWAYRTDTILVVTLDPESGAAGLLSIPRDLQVSIPGRGEDRINTANVYGYLQDQPGGGPALLKATIETNFGIPIDGYFVIDFQTFERIVDALGGIDVDVPKALHDTRYPDPRPGDPHAFKTIHFDPGPQHMDGQRALEYARSRMSTSDFDRAKRQQQVLLAIRERAFRLGAVPRWPALAEAVLDGIKTDVGAGELLSLAWLAARIDPAHLQQLVLKPPLVVGHRRADGAAVQLPVWNLINPELNRLFGPKSAR